jgi:hypothetical protein
MRCLSCNVVLSDKEATRKYASSGTYVDLCDHCFTDIADDVAVIEGNDTDGFEESSEEE